MLNSEELGFEECLVLVKDFYEAIPIDESDTDLFSKKENAEKALKHLEEMHGNNTEDEEDEDEDEDNGQDGGEDDPSGCPADVSQFGDTP